MPLHRLLTMNFVNNTEHVTSWMLTGFLAEKNVKPDISLLLEITYILIKLAWV